MQNVASSHHQFSAQGWHSQQQHCNSYHAFLTAKAKMPTLPTPRPLFLYHDWSNCEHQLICGCINQAEREQRVREWVKWKNNEKQHKKVKQTNNEAKTTTKQRVMVLSCEINPTKMSVHNFLINVTQNNFAVGKTRRMVGCGCQKCSFSSTSTRMNMRAKPENNPMLWTTNIWIFRKWRK